MLKRFLSLVSSVLLLLQLGACTSPGTVAEREEPAATTLPASAPTATAAADAGGLAIVYDDAETDSPIGQAAALLQQRVGGTLLPLESAGNTDFSRYEYILLGFDGSGNALPDPVMDFLAEADLGARTIFPFVTDATDGDAVLAAISNAEPGALLGEPLLLSGSDVESDFVTDWADSLGLNEEEVIMTDTVLSAVVDANAQQSFYLWEEGNIPATTNYTVNNGQYFDDPDFRPYVTSFPVPEGTAIKGAVLICPGGAFQYRSRQPEGVDVAEALSALGYQSFVVDYRLRPYTQQEGALDLARAVRFVRAHADDYSIDPNDIAVMGFSAGGILAGEMLLNFDGTVNGTALDPDYVPDELDAVSADAAADGMIYSFYGRLSVGTTDVELLRGGNLPPTFYCYGTRDPFYSQFLANADAAEQAGVAVQRLQLEDMPHGFGARGEWIPTFDEWLSGVFTAN